MNSLAKKIIDSLRKNSTIKIDYKTIKLEDLQKSEKNYLLFIIIKNIFFFNKKEFSFQLIKEKTLTHKWLDVFFERFIDLCGRQLDDDYTSYVIFNKFFTIYYNNIYRDFNDFIKSLEKVKTNFKYDLFSVLISFLSYINGNSEYLHIFAEFDKIQYIRDLESKYEKKINEKLLFILMNYCEYFNIKIPFTYKSDKNKCQKKVVEGLIELESYTQLCSNNLLYNKLINLMCIILKDCKDIRDNKNANIKVFIEEIFYLLIIYFNAPNFWEDFNLSIIISSIYQKAYDFTTQNFDQNYIDFIINYIIKFDIPSEEFIFLFFKGLIPGNFNATYKHLLIKKNIKDINNDDNFHELIEEMNKDKYDKNTKSEYDKKVENINDEPNKNYNVYEKQKNDNQYFINNQNSKSEDTGGQIHHLNNQKYTLNEDKQTLIEKNNKMKETISILTEENTYLKKKILNLIKGNNVNEIKLKQIKDEIFLLNKSLELISFRDLTRNILDKMISYVSQKDEDIFTGLKKRKEKLFKLNTYYEFKDIDFMKNPIKELTDKFYNSNYISHIPKIVEKIKKEPIGLNKDYEKIIEKEFYRIMIDSKKSEVKNFLETKLDLREEIKKLYLTDKY